jgi:hypothetical protein
MGEARLADAACAHDGDERVALDERHERRDICVAAVKGCDARGQVASGRPQLRAGARAGSGCARFGRLDGKGEAVPGAGHRDDGVGAQELAQRGHLHLQVVLLDDEARPYRPQQLVLGHRAIALLDQHEERVERAAADLEPRVALEQLALPGPQAKAAEAVFACRGRPLPGSTGACLGRGGIGRGGRVRSHDASG